MVHMDHTLKSYGIWMMEGEFEVHMDRMAQADRTTFAAGHGAMPANCPGAVTPSEPRAACALMAGSSQRVGGADSDDARAGTDELVDHQLLV
jgi:hypothetical protein